MQTWYEAYKDQGLMVISLFTEVELDLAPGASDLDQWANTYGQTSPVVSDVDWAVVSRFTDRPPPFLPSTTLLGPGATVILADQDVTGQTVIKALP
jgi:hypothetical protein